MSDDTPLDVLFNYIFPVLGIIFSNILFLSPIKTVRRIHSRQSLGAVNPLPYPFIFVNGAVRVLYSAVIQNYFIFFSNIFACVLGAYYTCHTIAICYSERLRLQEQLSAVIDQKPHTVSVERLLFSEQQHRRTIDHLTRMIRMMSLVGLLGLFVVLFFQFVDYVVLPTSHLAQDPAQMRHIQVTITGVLSVVCFCLFYVAPLSTLLQIIRTRNSESLDPWICITSILNGLFWTIYGWYPLHDGYIWIPNFAGFVMGWVQALCLCLFSRRSCLRRKRAASEDEETVINPSPLTIALDDVCIEGI